MMLTVIKSRTFIISLAIGISIVCFMVLKVQGFQYFTLWTKQQHIKIDENYLPDGLVDDSALGTVIAQLYQSPATVSSNGLISKTLQLFRDSSQIIMIDIITMLKRASDPRKTLNIHIARIDKKINELENQADLLQSISANKTELAKDCYQKKQDGDKLFLEGLIQDNPRLVDQGLANSVGDAPCYITNRIYANAYGYMRERLLIYKNALSYRSKFLEQNKESLIYYADRLDEPIDMELRRLQQELRQFNAFELELSQKMLNANINTANGSQIQPGTIEDFASFFMYGVPGSKTPLPKLNIWFNDNNVNVPNYEVGGFKQPSTSPVKDRNF